MKHQWTILSALAIASLLVTGCGGSGDEDSGSSGAKRKVVVFTPHGQEMLDEFEALFEEAYPNIDVVGRFTPTGQILSQLRIDKDSPQVDVWWGGTSAIFGQAKEQGLLAPYSPSWADAVEPSYRDPDAMWHAQFLQLPAIVYNNKLYKRDQIPSTWQGMLDPKWRNKIVIREVLDSGTMKTIYTGLIWDLGGPERKPEAGYDFLMRLDAATRKYVPNPQAMYDSIARSQEGYITLWNLTDAIFQREANGYPFGFVVPSDPVAVSLDPIAIVAGAPNREEAELFYEFVTSKESSIKLARDHYRILARADIPAEDLPGMMSDIKFAPMDIDTAEFDRLQVEWMDHWKREIRDPEK